MPRAFTPDERADIHAALLRAGREAFATRGVARTNVADLCAAAGIAKGSFYLFFESKEHALMAVVEEVELETRAALLAELDRLTAPRDVVRRFLAYHLVVFESHPVLQAVVQADTMRLLLRRLPPERIAEHEAADARFYTELVAGWAARGVHLTVDVGTLVGISRSMFALWMERDIVGDRFLDVVDHILDGLADRLVQS